MECSIRRYSSDATLAAAESEARSARRGLWADAQPIAPWEWRQAQNPQVPASSPQVRLAMGTISRVFRDLGLPYLRRTRKRAPRQLKLFEKAEPGESVRVDVKFVKIAGRWAFQYTALDDCTRFRVLRLYRRLHHGASLAFLAELRRALPFPIRRLQCDNGREFPLEFALALAGCGKS